MDTKIKEEMPSDNEEEYCKMDVDWTGRNIKEEGFSDDEGIMSEEIQFLAGPIKIEHPLDIYDEMSSNGFRTPSEKPDFNVANNKLTMKNVKSEDQQADHGFGNMRFEPTSAQEHPNPETDERTSIADYDTRKTGIEVSKMLTSAPRVTEIPKLSPSLTSEHCIKLESDQEALFPKADLEVQDNNNLFVVNDVEDGQQMLSTRTKPFQRDKFPKEFPQQSELQCHDVKNTGKQPVKCFKPKRAFSRTSSSKEHMMRAHKLPEKSFKCKECGKSFRRSSYLSSHRKVHTEEKPFTCRECNRPFARFCDLKVHERLHTGEKPFKCTVCEKPFLRNSHLKSHLKVHTGEKPFNCPECSRAFARFCDLKVHQRLHTGEKPFKCTVCEKPFVRSSHLKSHLKVHCGEKPFKCDICEKSFVHRSQFKVHQRLHTGEKPYNCNICEKSFVQCSTLKVHLRTHTGEKPFDCSNCEKSFTTASSLKVHQRVHTGKKSLRTSANDCS